MLPIIISVIGIICSIIGTFFVRTKEEVTQRNLLNSLRRGVYIAGGLAALIILPLILFVANNADEGSTMLQNVWGLYGAVLAGIIAGFCVSLFTEYYTSDASKPTRELAAASESGSAPLIIGGLSLGMKSAFGPILTVSGAALISFMISGGFRYVSSGALIDFNIGLYGIGLAAVSMLATNAIILATDAFGPVADNAGGIAQMAKLPEEVRERTDALDSLGNTTAATGKGFAIASNAFTGLALLVSYVNIAQTAKGGALNLSVVNPPVLIGIFAGSAVVFLFAALCMSAVQRAAQSIVHEVRRQFREIVGLMEGKADAEYATCVDICTRGALRAMIAPAMLVILSPIVVGILLGSAGVVGYLAGVIVTGFAMAVFMLNSGGAWDNAKKHIEAGNLGGKGSNNHKAAVIGDTVGDPLKDTAGPSFNNVITVSCTVAIVFIGITTAFSSM
jgi:K(+)-stimulated pyrophosphate-energized sodium pump